VLIAGEPIVSTPSRAFLDSPSFLLCCRGPGHLTAKSDVYAFGVVLLELLSGKEQVDERQSWDQRNLAFWAKPLLADRKKLPQLIDPKLGPNSPKAAQKLGGNRRLLPPGRQVAAQYGDSSDHPHQLGAWAGQRSGARQATRARQQSKQGVDSPADKSLRSRNSRSNAAGLATHRATVARNATCGAAAGGCDPQSRNMQSRERAGQGRGPELRNNNKTRLGTRTLHCSNNPGP